jgi:hypothetical protein
MFFCYSYNTLSLFERSWWGKIPLWYFDYSKGRLTYSLTELTPMICGSNYGMFIRQISLRLRVHNIWQLLPFLWEGRWDLAPARMFG